MTSNESITLKLNLLGKAYPVNCHREEEIALLRASRYLDEKMREIKETGKTIGLDRIAVMAALNLAYELLDTQKQMQDLQQSSQAQLSKLMERIDTALGDL